MLTGLHQRGDQKAGDRAIGNTLTGIARHQPDMAVVRVLADKAGKVHRLKHLTRPFVRDFACWIKARSRPTLQGGKSPLRIVRLPRLMVLATDNKKVGAITLLQTDIV